MSWATWLAVAVAVQGAATPAQLPRYKLEPGQRLRYEATRTTEFPPIEYERAVTNQDGSARVETRKSEAMSERARVVTAYTVLSRNDDGSVRLLVTEVEWIRVNGGEEGELPTTVALLDLYEDGRIKPGSSVEPRLDAARHFPPLPKDEVELESGWSRTTTDGWQTASLQGRVGAEGRMELRREIRDPAAEAAVRSRKDTLVFDAGKGVVIEVRSEMTQAHGGPSTSSSITTLTRAETLEAGRLLRLVAESERYVELESKWDSLEDRLIVSPDPERLYDATEKLVVERSVDFEDAEIARAALGLMNSLKGMKSFRLETAAERAKMIGRPAAGWELKDLEGKTHTLAQYRGKVVLLDFWNRACGPCLRSMPQLKRLVEECRGGPMVLLGLNTDEDVNDAKYVAALMQLSYPTLTLAADVEERYGVRGHPTLIVVGPDGQVADVHIGYDPDLRAWVLASIEKALDKGD